MRSVIMRTTASGGGSGGASVMGAAFAALSAGQWGTFTMGATPQIDFGDALFSYCQRMNWDPVSSRVFFGGASHGAPGTSVAKLSIYDDATNTWSQETIPDGRTDPRHAWYHGTLDRNTGDYYWFGFGGDNTLFRRSPLGVWTTNSYPYTPKNGTGFVEWHPGLFGGEGGVVRGDEWRITAYRRSTNSWTELLNSPSAGLMGDLNQVSCLNPADGLVYGGCGTGPGSGLTKLHRIANDGTATVVNTTQPATLAVWEDANPNRAAFIAPGNAANKIVACHRNGPIYEYDHVGATWSSQISTLPSALTSVQSCWYALCAISKYGGIMAVKAAVNPGGSPNYVMSPVAHIWKH